MDFKTFNQKLFHNAPYILYLIFGIILIRIPSMDLQRGTITTIGTVLIYAIIALGMNILLGYSGLISLGSAAFMGFSAYASAYLTKDLGMNFMVSLLISIGIPLVVGIIIGVVSLRLEGFYLAIFTLGIAEIFSNSITLNALKKYTNGGTPKRASYPTILGHEFADRTEVLVLISCVLVVLMILTFSMINSRTGRALHAMRGSEAAAQAMGINVLKYRLIAFGLSTFYASVAGVLYVHFFRVSSNTTWTLTLSLNLIAIIVIGGMRSISGTVLGAFIVYGLKDLVLTKIPGIEDVDGMSYVISGAAILLIVLLYPNGLMNLFKEIGNKIIKYTKKLYHTIFPKNKGGIV